MADGARPFYEAVKKVEFSPETYDRLLISYQQKLNNLGLGGGLEAVRDQALREVACEWLNAKSSWGERSVTMPRIYNADIHSTLRHILFFIQSKLRAVDRDRRDEKETQHWRDLSPERNQILSARTPSWYEAIVNCLIYHDQTS